jgi:hypothetical protein
MDVKLSDIAKQLVIKNPCESREFIDWIDSLDSISIKYIPREMYENKYKK